MGDVRLRVSQSHS
jgi:hypothetical protein